MKPLAIFLDSGPLSLLCTSKHCNEEALAWKKWCWSCLQLAHRVFLPEIADYEVRRELHRARRIGSVRRLDFLANDIEYAAITTSVMRRVAEMWAELRQHGLPTASDDNIDADVILAAQAQMLGEECIIATSNSRHLDRLVPAADWKTIIP